jgi:endonuclease/exonuclease/phosphatase family metal-dependent hydrolase
MKKLFCSLLIAFTVFALPLYSQVEIKIMSFNIRLDVKSDGDNQWDKRKERVATMLNYYEADFIGLQEVLHHQKEYLTANLPKYSVTGVGRDDGKQAGEYSCIYYRNDKYQLLETATFWLSTTPDEPSKGWDAALNRVCTYGLFKNKKTKQKIWVFNTHFDHVGKTARLESAKLIFQKINQINQKGFPVILSGDFNSKPEEAPAQYLQSVMQNSREKSLIVHGNADTWNAFRFNEKPNGCIDYIFLNPNNKLTALKFATITDSYEMKYPSDHFPILATLSLNR